MKFTLTVFGLLFINYGFMHNDTEQFNNGIAMLILASFVELILQKVEAYYSKKYGDLK